ncbi:MAG: YheT family hydrolase [Pirellulaceae bacterium]
MFSTFIPHPLVRGGHAQTVLGCYLPGLKWSASAQQHKVSLPDSDQLVLHDDLPGNQQWRDGDRVALLVHGLGGCHQSTYMQRTAAKLVGKGVRVFRMDLRDCGAGAGLARLPVHAGRSDDVGSALLHVIECCPDSPVFLVGFSMGANHVLKLLGELGSQRPANLAGAMAVAPPIDLPACARNMETGLNQLYNRKFLRGLLRAAAVRNRRVPKEFAPPLDPPPRHLREFDQRFTAPLGGFASAEDYYERSGAGRTLKNIAVPTVIVAAADDPIVPVKPFETATYSSTTQLVITPSGGHLGFFGTAGMDPDRRWLDWRIVEWATTSQVPRHRDSLATTDIHWDIPQLASSLTSSPNSSSAAAGR